MSGFASDSKRDANESMDLNKTLDNLKVSEKLAPKNDKKISDKSDDTGNTLHGNNELEHNTLQEKVAGVSDENEKEKSVFIVKKMKQSTKD